MKFKTDAAKRRWPGDRRQPLASASEDPYPVVKDEEITHVKVDEGYWDKKIVGMETGDMIHFQTGDSRFNSFYRAALRNKKTICKRAQPDGSVKAWLVEAS